MAAGVRCGSIEASLFMTDDKLPRSASTSSTPHAAAGWVEGPPLADMGVHDDVIDAGVRVEAHAAE